MDLSQRFDRDKAENDKRRKKASLERKKKAYRESMLPNVVSGQTELMHVVDHLDRLQLDDPYTDQMAHIDLIDTVE